MMDDKLLKPQQVAEILGVKTQTLTNWRYYEKHKIAKASSGIVLPWVELPNGIIRYKESEVKKWIESQSIENKTDNNII
jgi:predicted DNA-binding transcriptional regulator AlpA